MTRERRMTPSSVLSEALRNLSTGTAHGVLLALALTLVTTVLALADASAVIALERQAIAFQRSAAHVRALVATGMVDGGACDALSSTTAVTASGALSAVDPVRLRAMDSVDLQTFEVTPSFAAVLGLSGPAPDGAWLSQDLAEVLQLQVGDAVETGSGLLTVAGVYAWPDDGRDARLDLAILLPTAASGAFDECWAASWPLTDDTDELLRSTVRVVPTSREAITVSQVNRSSGTTLDTQAALDARPTARAPLVCAAAGYLVGFFAVRRRRLEHAGALHAGQSRTAQTITVLIETLVWVLASTATTLTLVGLWIHLAEIPDTRQVVEMTVVGPVVAAVCTILGALAATATIRESQLFAYFKNR
jgi:hypothetical protein